MLALDQVTVRPVNGLPAASRRTAVACVVAPIATDADASVTDTDATGAGGGSATVTAVVELMSSATAEIVALPPPIAFTNPAGPTVATAVLELDQFTARSASGTPDASRTVAESVAVSPVVSERLAGDTTTDAAGITVTDTGADEASPLDDA